MQTATLRWSIAEAPPTREEAAEIVGAADDHIVALRSLGADEEADAVTRARDAYVAAAARYYDARESGWEATAP